MFEMLLLFKRLFCVEIINVSMHTALVPTHLAKNAHVVLLTPNLQGDFQPEDQSFSQTVKELFTPLTNYPKKSHFLRKRTHMYNHPNRNIMKNVDGWTFLGS